MDPLLKAFFGSSHRISRGVQSIVQVTSTDVVPFLNRINHLKKAKLKPLLRQ